MPLIDTNEVWQFEHVRSSDNAPLQKGHTADALGETDEADCT